MFYFGYLLTSIYDNIKIIRYLVEKDNTDKIYIERESIYMSKASRKIERYNVKKEDVITEQEIQNEYGKMTIVGRLITALNFFTWIGLTWQNMLIMVAIFVAVSCSVELYLQSITTAVSAAIISHGLVTSLLIAVFFTFIKRKEETKPSALDFFFRYLALGIALAAISALTAVFF